MDQKELMGKFVLLSSKYFPHGHPAVEIPPPVFTAMGGEFVSIDAENSVLEVKFPVPTSSLNPFGSMQGGMIAAAIDNTIGPLSMLVAPLNFTRTFELKYSKAVSRDLEYITVKARLVERIKRRLFFSAEVRDPEGNSLVTAKSTHWIVGESI